MGKGDLDSAFLPRTVGDAARCTVDAEGLILEANEAAAPYLAREPSQCVGASLDACMRVSERRSLADDIGRCLRGETAAVVVNLNLAGTKDGPCEPVVLTSETLPDGHRAILFRRADDRAERWLTVLDDAAALLRAPAPILERLQSVARLLTQSFADLVIIDVHDAGGESVRRVAVAATAIAERAAAPLAAYPPKHAGTPAPLVEAIQVLHPIFLDEPAREIVLGCAARDFENAIASLPVTSAAFVPLLGHGQSAGAAILFTCERPRLQQKDGVALGLVSELVADALEHARLEVVVDEVHARHRSLIKMAEQEMRSSLAVITLGVDSLLRKTPVDDRRSGKKNLEAIHRAAARLTATAGHMADSLGLDASESKLRPEVHKARVIILAVIERCSPFALEKKVNVAVECPPVLECWCDFERTVAALSAIMRELLRRAPHGDAPVVVRVEKSGKTAVRFSFVHPDEARPGQPQPWKLDSDGPFDLFAARVLIALQHGAIDMKSAVEGTTISTWLPSRSPRP